MPLSKLKQAEYQRARRARIKAESQPNLTNKLGAVGLHLDSNRVSLLPQSKSGGMGQEKIPIYNPQKHKAGDRVLKYINGQWKEITVPDLDADGYVML